MGQMLRKGLWPQEAEQGATTSASRYQGGPGGQPLVLSWEPRKFRLWSGRCPPGEHLECGSPDSGPG